MSVDQTRIAKTRRQTTLAGILLLTGFETTAQWGGVVRPETTDPNANLLDDSEEEIRGLLMKAFQAANSRGTAIYVNKALRFGNGSVSLSEKDVSGLGKLARSINSESKLKMAMFHLEGHANATGSRELNLRLTQQRADNVRQVLVNRYGIAGHRVSATGFGYERPLPDSDPRDPANRRVEIQLKQM